MKIVLICVPVLCLQSALCSEESRSTGDILFPELYIHAAGGFFGGGLEASDLAISNHDPQEDAGLQAVEAHLNFDLDGRLTGGIYAIATYSDGEWDGQLEEAFALYHFSNGVAVGGGQFLNAFGFQADGHLHQWDFVNQNLTNARYLNEGELVTRGGEMVLPVAGKGRLTIAGGLVRTHSHDHEEEHGEEEHGDEMEEEHGHLEGELAAFDDWVASADLKMPLLDDGSLDLSVSLATGKNGFGRRTTVAGLGIEKIFDGHDHGDGMEFCSGAMKIRGEVLGRSVEAVHEDGDELRFEDLGISAAAFYGVSDRVTLGFRGEWLSEAEEIEQEARFRISPALTARLDKAGHVQARLQYDYSREASGMDSHAGWLQIQIRLGGEAGGHQH